MAAAPHPTDTPMPDPAQLGAEAGPATPAPDDSHDMTTVLADADQGRPFATPPAQPQQGSAFDQQRRQGATGDQPDQSPRADVGPGQGMGRTSGGDEDRGYDQGGIRGGLGSSGGREDLSERQPAPDPNPFTGGYDGGGTDQPPASQTQHLGLNTPSPTTPQP